MRRPVNNAAVAARRRHYRRRVDLQRPCCRAALIVAVRAGERALHRIATRRRLTGRSVAPASCDCRHSVYARCRARAGVRIAVIGHFRARQRQRRRHRRHRQRDRCRLRRIGRRIRRREGHLQVHRAHRKYRTRHRCVGEGAGHRDIAVGRICCRGIQLRAAQRRPIDDVRWIRPGDRGRNLIRRHRHRNCDRRAAARKLAVAAHIGGRDAVRSRRQRRRRQDRRVR